MRNAPPVTAGLFSSSPIRSLARSLASAICRSRTRDIHEASGLSSLFQLTSLDLAEWVILKTDRREEEMREGTVHLPANGGGESWARAREREEGRGPDRLTDLCVTNCSPLLAFNPSAQDTIAGWHFVRTASFEAWKVGKTDQAGSQQARWMEASI